MKITLERILPSIFADIEKVIQIISYILIILLALFLLFKEFFHKEKKHNEYMKEEIIFEKNNFLLALLIGLVPCPGTITLLIFSISLQIYPIGILSAFAMAVGMALTVSAFGIVSTLGKSGVEKTALELEVKAQKIETALKLTGPLLMIFWSSSFLYFLLK